MQPATDPSVAQGRAHGLAPPPSSADRFRQRLVGGDLSPALAGLEELRRRALRCRVVASGFGAIPLVLILVLAVVLRSSAAAVDNLDPNLILALLAVVLVSLLICGVLFARFFRLRREFRSGFKDAVYPEAIRLLDPSFRYTRDAGISLQRFKEGRMFLHRVDWYGSEDHVCGTYGATTFEFAEVRASYETKDSEGDRVERPVFGGLYFTADFNKHFVTRTVIVPAQREALGAIKELLDAFGLERGNVVQLEDPEFERAFVVYGEDDIEVRYLLSPSLMQRILALRGNVGRRISLSFLRGELHVAVSRSGAMFEPSLVHSAYSMSQVERYLAQVRGVLAVIDDLNLNTRIWSKA